MALSLCVFSTSAELISFTAEGTVSSSYIYNSTTGTYNYNTIPTSTTVHYSFLFDTEQNGLYTYPDGSTYFYNDYANVDYYYADFQGAFVLTGLSTSTGGVYNVGYESTYNNTFQNYILGGTSNHYVYIYNNSSLDSWNIGTAVTGYEYNSSPSGSVTSNLTITGMASAVPEPSMLSMLLSSIALLGSSMVFVRKKRIA
jgi:hypothetical protein